MMMVFNREHFKMGEMVLVDPCATETKRNSIEGRERRIDI